MSSTKLEAEQWKTGVEHWVTFRSTAKTSSGRQASLLWHSCAGFFLDPHSRWFWLQTPGQMGYSHTPWEQDHFWDGRCSGACSTGLLPVCGSVVSKWPSWFLGSTATYLNFEAPTKTFLCGWVQGPCVGNVFCHLADITRTHSWTGECHLYHSLSGPCGLIPKRPRLSTTP